MKAVVKDIREIHLIVVFWPASALYTQRECIHPHGLSTETAREKRTAVTCCCVGGFRCECV